MTRDEEDFRAWRHERESVNDIAVGGDAAELYGADYESGDLDEYLRAAYLAGAAAARADERESTKALTEAALRFAAAMKQHGEAMDTEAALENAAIEYARKRGQ